jgi:hypothetical protein
VGVKLTTRIQLMPRSRKRESLRICTHPSVWMALCSVATMPFPSGMLGRMRTESSCADHGNHSNTSYFITIFLTDVASILLRVVFFCFRIIPFIGFLICILARGSVVVKALCYKPEGRGFDTRGGDFFFFNLPNPSCRTRPWSLLSL